MTAPLSVGFLTPQPARISVGPLMVTPLGAASLEDPSAVPDWDYFTPLRVERRISTDTDGIRGDCGLPAGAVIAAALTWHSSWTNIRGTGPLVRLADGVAHLTLEVPGELLGSRLTVDTRVVLHEPRSTQSRLAPHRPGSTLWNLSNRIDLEGTGPRFPIMVLEFSKHGLSAGGTPAWLLQIETDDLSASGVGCLRLLLNSEHPRLQAVLDDPASPDGPTIREMIRFDSSRRIVFAALTCDELRDELDYEEGTLGDLLLRLTRRLFPGRTLQTLRGDLSVAMGELEAELQSRLRFLA